jgi:phosphatidylinositol phospholipase C delta
MEQWKMIENFADTQFLHYLTSDECLPIKVENYEILDDMTKPLSNYIINSSHNTYLKGNQVFGVSSLEMYARALLAGCRCVELDLWDGENGPIITHSWTLTKNIQLRPNLKTI